MCLVALAFKLSEQYPVVLAANRDEFYRRPARAMHWWQEGFLAGRDLAKGGTWLGFHPQGRWGLVLNFRERPAVKKELSRGEILRLFLGGQLDLSDCERLLQKTGGAHLLLSTDMRLFYISNRDSSRELAGGLYVLSNGKFGEPWFKVRLIQDKANKLLAARDFSQESWMSMLLDKSRAPLGEELPKTGYPPLIEHFLSSPFIAGALYGTRSTAFARRSAQGYWTVAEWVHVPPTGLSFFEFQESPSFPK
ncbi:MAG: NRDE family protein [Leptospiraceae bacterium]|nr:NRDE family protein [Leptospiraceae bacterium]MDW8307436.1 NRDE family protein [Leptospiraceae bacterium]